MSDQPALSILIPWRNRDEIRLTLAANAPIFRANHAEILVLNCAGNAQRLRELIIASGVPGVRQLDIAVPQFNKSLALNIGLSYAKADDIFVLDADVVLLSLIPVEAQTDCSFVTIEWKYESEPVETKQPLTRADAILELTFRNGSKVRHQLARQDLCGNIRAGIGLLLAKKRDLLDIQGYNSELQTWGWEDDDVVVRLQYVLGRRRVQSGAALHLTHGDNRRAVNGSRGESGQRNFIKCCRNYNHGLFLGSYRSDLENVAGKVTETVVDVVTSKPGAAIHPAGQHSQSFTPALMYCGNEIGIISVNGRDRSKRPPSIGELLIEAALTKYPLDNCDILHVGIGSSRLATQLSSRCRHITGVASDDDEKSIATGLRLPNYDVLVANKYTDTFPKQLPLRAYDIIIDYQIASHACCRQHWRTLMESYSSLLTSKGWLATAEPGLRPSATYNCWNLSDADLACLASEFHLCVAKAGCGVYSLVPDLNPVPGIASEFAS